MSGEGVAPGRRGEITGGPWYDEAWLLDHYPEAAAKLRARIENGEAIEVGTFYGYDPAAGADSTAEIAFSLQPGAINWATPAPAVYPPVDEFGMSEEAWRWERWEYQREALRERWAALRMLWGKPIRDRWEGSIRARGEEWTFWRAVKATIGIILDRRHTDAHGKSWLGMDMGHWDYRSGGCGGCSWSAMVLQLHAWCRIEILSDSD